jgi:hypothetical protein
VTLQSAAAARRLVTKLRHAKADAEGRDKLDAQITAMEAEKKALPAVSNHDCG